MGSIFKRIKKTFKKVTKPLSKMTKGIARGIAKVGKAVMKGVGKINNKFGPLGSIALAIAMPYAMQGIGVGWTKMAGMNNPFGTFLKAVGKRGSSIMNGVNRATGFVREGFSNITRGIMDTFSGFSNRASQSNIWKSISNGAKNLYRTAKELTPKFRTGKAGTVEVFGGPANQYSSMMNTDLVAQGLKEGTIQASQLGTKQTLGSAEGWFTKAGSSEADKLVTETINKTFENSIGNSLDSNTRKYLMDVHSASLNNKTGANYYDAWDSIKNNAGVTKNYATDFSTEAMYSTDFAKTGDYTLGTARDRASGTYNFNGNKTFDNPVAKHSNAKKYITKKNVSSVGAAAMDSLLKKQDIIIPHDYDWIATQGATSDDGYTAHTSSTDISGATGSSNYAKVFGDAAWHKLKAYHKNMNYLGSI
jgi:hypothetical protein|tara:strand:+ start:67 stop:1323 length:1257 start_codon:yes stop_codon:yes gene_type:complete